MSKPLCHLAVMLCLVTELAYGADKIVVAVIDTGLDLKNSKLSSHLWINPGESGLDEQGRPKESNQIDDDQNGYVDDVNGWNFAKNNHDLLDHHGHGTHITGIITSIAPDVTIMPLKYYDSQANKLSAGVSNVSSTVQAIRYAIQMKVQIINFSGGGAGYDPEEEQVILQAENAGILIVAAAGNDGHSTDRNGFYPASYKASNIISVASVDQKNHLLPSSNFGKNSVDIAALGKDVISDVPGQTQAMMTGTSQATAFVSGTAAKLLTEGFKPIELLKDIIWASAQFEPALGVKLKVGRVLSTNMAQKMKSTKQTSMGQVIERPQKPITLQSLQELVATTPEI